MSCGGRGGAFSSGGRGGNEVLREESVMAGLFSLESLGLRIVACVLMDIPESMLDGVQGVGKTGDPNAQLPSDDPGVSTFRIENWKS